jgi:hypothetical protein
MSANQDDPPPQTRKTLGDKVKPWLLPFGIWVGFCFLIWLVWYAFGYYYLPNWHDSQTGNTFDALNALFAGWAFSGVIIALFFQTQEMTQQAKDAKEAAEAQERTAKTQERAAEAQERAAKALNKQADSLSIAAHLNALEALRANYQATIDNAHVRDQRYGGAFAHGSEMKQGNRI